MKALIQTMQDWQPYQPTKHRLLLNFTTIIMTKDVIHPYSKKTVSGSTLNCTKKTKRKQTKNREIIILKLTPTGVLRRHCGRDRTQTELGLNCGVIERSHQLPLTVMIYWFLNFTPTLQQHYSLSGYQLPHSIIIDVEN